MNPEEFVTRVRERAYNLVASETFSLLQKPPGRRPSPRIVALSQWFNHLSPDDKERIRTVIEMTAGNAIFEMLAVLDGVASIRGIGEETDTLELRYVKGNESFLLNAPTGEFLHDIFASQVPPL